MQIVLAPTVRAAAHKGEWVGRRSTGGNGNHGITGVDFPGRCLRCAGIIFGMAGHIRASGISASHADRDRVGRQPVRAR